VARRTAVEAAQTREALLDAATRLFVDDGFHDVSIDAIATAAGVTRGAVYHHFPDGKAAIFEAIYRRELAQFDAQMTDAGTRAVEETGDLWAGLWAGTDRYLELCTGPTFARIALYEGPAALGYERWEAIDTEFSVAQFQGILELLMATGDIDPQPVEPLARILVGAYNMAARQIVIADDPARAVEIYGDALRTLVRGLRAADDG
jgi:AcrR family transcriptional regulator